MAEQTSTPLSLEDTLIRAHSISRFMGRAFKAMLQDDLSDDDKRDAAWGAFYVGEALADELKAAIALINPPAAL
ncbi:MAG TPA: hypothetical protein VFA75_12765 [Nevskia sp.]|nr:hypothetical protein [Nevskia sp.]